MHDIGIAPSLICCDLCNIEQELLKLEDLDVDFLHIDLVDAHFSPSMPMGIEIIQQAKKISNLPFDVHLIVENNELFIYKLRDIDIQKISFHYESAFHVDRLISLIQENRIKAGIALMPMTPLSVLDYCVERIDFVLLMLINPGFAGQKGEVQVPYAEKKIADCHKYLRDRGVDIPIEVDGRVSFENISGLVAMGADILVAGSQSIFHANHSLEENFEKIKRAISIGVKMRK